MPQLNTSYDVGAFLAAANKSEAKGALGINPTSYNTNTDKLSATGLESGAIAIITQEGNRVELFLGGSNVDSNWIVLRNTINLTISNLSLNDVTINGVLVEADTSTNVGWVDPLNIPVETVYMFSFGQAVIDSAYIYNFPWSDTTASYFQGTEGSFALPAPSRASVSIVITDPPP